MSTAIFSQGMKHRYRFSNRSWYSALGMDFTRRVISRFKSTRSSMSWLISFCKSTIFTTASAIRDSDRLGLRGIPVRVAVAWVAKSLRAATC